MAEQAPVHDPLELIAPYKRRWVLPILKGLEELGGGARPIELKRLFPKLFTGALLEHEWQEVFDKGQLGWARFDMVKVGLLGGPNGRWELTDLGRACLNAHRDDPIEIPQPLRGNGDPELDTDTVETVAVTLFRAHEIPLLRLLEAGPVTKRGLVEAFGIRYLAGLRPGDSRLMPESGQVVWKYRLGWTLNALKRAGEAQSPELGTWEITPAGRARLASESGTWKLEDFGPSMALVLREGQSRQPNDWLIAPGEDAHLWEFCRAMGEIRVGWFEVATDLSGVTPEELEELVTAAYGEKNTGAVRGLRDFCCKMAPGDRLYVKKGKRTLLGMGTIESDYFYDDQHESARHARKVKWEQVGRWSLPDGWSEFPMKTLTELPTHSHSVEALEELMKTGAPPQPPLIPYPLSDLSRDTHTPEATLQTWLRALERKGQAVLYGPPGTGKTFVAEKLARHLVAGGDGFVELVQFHPAYAYEDFIQGIRPRTVGGKLDYVLEPGRFREFCAKAAGCKGPCVLIIDEINRANLARVFGELMYLLEYREAQVPLAGGSTLKIPGNVRLIGTMNTADRSIALVDHALRRRFAFIGLYPNHQVLKDFHKGGADQGAVPGLVAVLERLNRAINDRHYEVGISFFLKPGLEAALPDIWQMEIEPYLEEYFFDKPAVVDQFRWAKIEGEILK